MDERMILIAVVVIGVFLLYKNCNNRNKEYFQNDRLVPAPTTQSVCGNNTAYHFNKLGHPVIGSNVMLRGDTCTNSQTITGNSIGGTPGIHDEHNNWYNTGVMQAPVVLTCPRGSKVKVNKATIYHPIVGNKCGDFTKYINNYNEDGSQVRSGSYLPKRAVVDVNYSCVKNL